MEDLFYIRSIEPICVTVIFSMKTYYCCCSCQKDTYIFLHFPCGCLIHLHSRLQHALCVWGTLSSNPICQPLFRLSGITTGEENSSVSALCVCVCVCGLVLPYGPTPSLMCDYLLSLLMTGWSTKP